MPRSNAFATIAGQFIPRTGYASNVAQLVGGSLLAKVVVIGSAPVLSRLFDPAAFGVLGIFTTATAFLAIGASLRYPRAIVLPDSDREASAVFWLSSLLVAVGSVIVGILVWWNRGIIAGATNAPSLSSLAIVVAPILFVSGMYEVFEFWATRRKRFARMSMSHVARSTSTVVAQFLAGLAGFAAGGLVVGFGVGKLSSTGVLAWSAFRDDRALLRKGRHWTLIVQVASRFRDFARFSLPANLLSRGSVSAVPVLLSALFDPVIAGYYWFASRLIAVVHDSIGQSIRRVFCQRATELHNGGHSTYRLLVKNTLLLALIALPPAGLVILFGPRVFDLAFGSMWWEAGAYARWLVIMGVAELASVPATELIYIFAYQRWQLGYQLAQTGLRIGAVLYGAAVGDPMIAIATMSVSIVLCNCVLICVIALRSRRATMVPPAFDA